MSIWKIPFTDRDTDRYRFRVPTEFTDLPTLMTRQEVPPLLTLSEVVLKAQWDRVGHITSSHRCRRPVRRENKEKPRCLIFGKRTIRGSMERLQSFHKKPSTRPTPIVPSTCHMCHIWTRIFCSSDYISKIARAEPDGSAMLGPE